MTAENDLHIRLFVIAQRNNREQQSMYITERNAQIDKDGDIIEYYCHNFVCPRVLLQKLKDLQGEDER